jgi:hypothetical protein
MAARDSQIVDLLLGSQATIKRFEAALEAEKQASSIELRILRERNSILEKEVVRLQSLLKDAERAMLVSCIVDSDDGPISEPSLSAGSCSAT